nr:hypothetical protein [Corynebacterium lactis]
MTNPQNPNRASGDGGSDFYGNPQGAEDLWSSIPGGPVGGQSNPFEQATQAMPAVAPVAVAQKNNTGLYIAIGVMIALLFALMAGGGWLLASSKNGSSNSANGGPAAAGNTASSTSSTSSAAQTYTETVTQEAKPSSSSATPTRSPKSLFNMSRNTYGVDFDEKGWIGNSARCGTGDHARVLAEADGGWIVICENSSNRQEKYYIGHFGNISTSPDAYRVDSFSNRKVVAVNDQIQYVLTPQSIEVFNANGDSIFEDRVVDYGVLQAG